MRRYLGKFNKFRNDRWVVGDRSLVSGRGEVAHLLKFSWTNIVRHQTVNGTASPDDPALTKYWTHGGDGSNLRWTVIRCACSNGRAAAARSAETPCSPPTSHQFSHQQWENWWQAITRKAIRHDYLVHLGRPGRPGNPDGDQTRLVDASRQRARRTHHRRSTAHPGLSS
jgi:RNA-directed DNA polymerase